jgi:hypothetical protein
MKSRAPCRAPFSLFPFILGTLVLLSPCHLVTLSPCHLQAGEMKDEWPIDVTNMTQMRSLFGSHGYRPNRTITLNASGIRMKLPEGSPKESQTSLYSKFALAGDGEASFIYELLNVPAPKEGYGCGVGLAFDPEGGGYANIQRVIKSAKDSVYVLQISPEGASQKLMKKEYVQVPTTAKRGRIGLRRVKKELIFLAADDPGDELKEIGRLPFTDRTIRPVRIFVDAGGSPTMVDVRVRDLQMRAESLTGGVPTKEEAVSIWRYVWILAVIASLGLLFWRWHVHQRQFREENEEAPRGKPHLKKTGGAR